MGSSPQPKATPRAQEAAKRHAIPLGEVVGTGWGGAITEIDVARANAKKAEERFARLEEEAEPFRHIEFSEENWRQEFGEDLTVETPLGPVKLGDNQDKKLKNRSRTKDMGLIRPTLERPSMVVENTDSQGRSARLYLKGFQQDDGAKHFVSVVVDVDGKQVSISSYRQRPAQARKAIATGSVLYETTALTGAATPAPKHAVPPAGRQADGESIVPEGDGAVNESEQTISEPRRKPWEMRRDDFVGKQTEALKSQHSWAEIEDPEWMSGWQGNQKISHRNAVRRAVTEGESVPREVLEDYRGRQWADEALGDVEQGEGNNSSNVRLSQRLREIRGELPVDNVEPKWLNTAQPNEGIILDGATEFQSWPEKVTAADGVEILLQNPEDGSFAQRTRHLVWDRDKGVLHLKKAQWLSNVPDTLRSATTKLRDPESGNSIYVRLYEAGEHMVVTDPSGHVVEQGPEALITQFPYDKPGRQENMEEVWRRDNGLGRVPGHPDPTPDASPILDSKRRTFQENDTTKVQTSQVEDSIAPTLEKWDNAPTVHVVQSESDLPPHILESKRPDGAIRGVYVPSPDTVYIVADALDSVDQANFPPKQQRHSPL